MLLFGHLRITLGAALLVDGAVTKYRSQKKQVSGEDTSASAPELGKAVYDRHLLDLRLLLVGSLLPDLIDKPVGMLILSDVFQNGRIFAHTLLFFVLLLSLGIYLYQRRGRNWLLMLSLGDLSHIVLDSMWAVPQTLFWPLFGCAFPRVAGDWSRIARGLLTNPAVYVSELIGLFVVGWVAFTLLRSHRVRFFVRNGRL